MTKTKFIASAGGSLVLFAVFSMFMSELKYTEMKHGSIQRAENVIEHSVKISEILARSGVEFWDSSMLGVLATYAAEIESRGDYFVMGFDSSLADTLPPYPICAGFYNTKTNFLTIEHEFTVDNLLNDLINKIALPGGDS